MEEGPFRCNVDGPLYYFVYSERKLFTGLIVAALMALILTVASVTMTIK